MRDRNRKHLGSRFFAVTLAGILATCVVGGTASAQQPKAGETQARKPTAAEKETARKHYEAGKKKLDNKEYADALPEFQAANAAVPSPQALEKIALCYDGMNDVANALQAYEQFLQQSEGNAKLEQARDQARERVEALKKMPVPITITSEPMAAQVTIDGQSQTGNSPLRLELPPGKHTVMVTAPGYETEQQEIEIQPGEAPKGLTFTLTKVPEPVVPPPPPPPPATTPPPPPPPPPEPVAEKSNVPAYITLGVAGAGAIVGTIFGVKALGNKSDFDDKPNVKDADDAERNAIIADMAFGVAVTMGITGTVLLLTNNSGQENKAKVTLPTTARKPTLRVSPYVGRHSGGAAATLTF